MKPAICRYLKLNAIFLYSKRNTSVQGSVSRYPGPIRQCFCPKIDNFEIKELRIMILHPQCTSLRCISRNIPRIKRVAGHVKRFDRSPCFRFIRPLETGLTFLIECRRKSNAHQSFQIARTAGVALETETEAVHIASDDPSGQPASSHHKAPLCGAPEPLGSSLNPFLEATNFAVVATNAWGVSLCLFTMDDLKKGDVTEEVPLHPIYNKTGNIWHVSLPKLDSSLLYGFRVFGPHQETESGQYGQRMDPSRVLLDPYGKAILNGRTEFKQMGPDLDYSSDSVLGIATTWPQAACALPSPSDDFDWEGDRQLQLPMEDLVIYEAHVRGFTAHPTSGIESLDRGTYAGLTRRLDYLKWLGINALELMPIHEFNELEYYDVSAPHVRYNFWGYSTVGFFAPMARYSAANAREAGGQSIINEFKTLVKEAHKRGIEIILDVVFNHTAEGNEDGPCLSFRGLDNRVYYMLAPQGQYYNYSGCGNTVNCNQPVVRQFIVDCLKYWVEEMHVDGFRFDLGSIMTRAHSVWHPAREEEEDVSPDSDIEPEGAAIDEQGLMTDGAGVPTGTPLSDPALIASISEDPVLSGVKLIAEAWDCDGLNQVGAFPHYGRWSEWNGHFRDAVRQFIKGSDGPWAGNMAAVICGSPHIYVNEPGESDWWGNNGGRKWKGGRGPTASINFVTAHDGFTLRDLISYNEKKNFANGEDNRDGESHNLSWNCGEEGPSSLPQVNALRSRQARNMLAALFVAHGVPMLHMGDEAWHTKGGNNNTYCHDSELNYLDWEAVETDAEGLVRFVRHMIALRMSKSELRRSSYVTEGDIEWHGVDPGEPDWSESSRFLGFTLKSTSSSRGGGLYVAFNTGHLPVVVGLPKLHRHVWEPIVDTGKRAPYDILVQDDLLSAADIATAKASLEMWTLENKFPMLPWSCIILESIPSNRMPEMPRKQKSPPPGPTSHPATSSKAPKKKSTVKKTASASPDKQS